MRRLFYTAAMLAIAVGGPLQARAGDREIAEQIINRLKVHRDTGKLKDFTLDLKVNEGVVLLRGNVTQAEQKEAVLAATKGVEGVANVVDQIEVGTATVAKAKGDVNPAIASEAKGESKGNASQALATDAKGAATKAIATATPQPVQDASKVKAAPAEAAKPANKVAEAAKPAPGFSFRDALLANASKATANPKPVVIPAEEKKGEGAFFDPASEMLQSDSIIKTAATTEPGSVPLPVFPSQSVTGQAVTGQVGFGRVAAGQVVPTQVGDAHVTSAVVSALGNAQKEGQLKGFGVDVNTREGVVHLTGRASSAEQRQMILALVREAPGVVDVVENIAIIPAQTGMPQTQLQPMPLTQPDGSFVGPGGVPARMVASRTPGVPNPAAAIPGMVPGAMMVNPGAQVPYPSGQGFPGQMAAGRGGVPAQMVPYQMGQGVPAQTASSCPPGGYPGAPVPMAPYSGVGGGHDQAYLPNYAWPGYAAYPNYAAVTYPQQYSPTAFPYIGPFYPYPQVPLGWRRVSLEWDDGWWYLDFTDR